MIKSPTQLKKAQERLIAIQKLLLENSQKYSGLELEVYNAALIIEENNLLDEIIEYQKLRDTPFVDAVTSLLSKPVLIDNIGELLAKLRIAAKLPQSGMAQRLGWEQSNLSRFESENYNAQTISKIVEYASLLGIWLHVRPSLTEEAIVKDKKRPEVRAQKIDSLDIASTSINYSDEYASDSLESRSYFVVDSEKQKVISI